MGRYKFEIQNCIEVIINGESPEEARDYLVNNTDIYSDEMLRGSCYISDGIETNEKN